MAGMVRNMDYYGNTIAISGMSWILRTILTDRGSKVEVVGLDVTAKNGKTDNMRLCVFYGVYDMVCQNITGEPQWL